MKVDISAGLRDWRGDEESHCLFSFILTVSPSYIGFEGFKRGIPEKGSWGGACSSSGACERAGSRSEGCGG